MDDKTPNETMNIALPEMLKTFVHDQVAAKGYTSASEYVRELIRAAQEKAMWDEIEQLVLEGLHSGPSLEITPEYWQDKRRKLRERIGGTKSA
jgi:antitoxin ParD1/3/4